MFFKSNQYLAVENYKYIVEPGKLTGKVQLSGAKNSALKLLTASILTSGDIHLSNYPSGLLDVQIHEEMLKIIGKDCIRVGESEILLKEHRVNTQYIDWQGRSIRNTLLMLGALLTRFGQGAVPLPGGCKLGERKFDLHEMIFRSMGAEVWIEGDYLHASVKGKLKGCDIHLPMRSTGATENAIICGSLASGTTRVWNPHIRPEIMDLVNMINKMGGKITVHGQEHIEIIGQEGLGGVKHSVIPDNMEAITWLIGSVMTGGDIEIDDFPMEHLDVPLIFLKESGARFYRSDNSVIIRGGKCLPLEISTGPYPGINSDMQPIMAAYASRARGESRITDLRFLGRYQYASEMQKIGFKSSIEGNILKIHGVCRIVGGTAKALDLRAGVALTLLGLISEGPVTITDAWQIDRGYDNFVSKFSALEGKIRKIDD